MLVSIACKISEWNWKAVKVVAISSLRFSLSLLKLPWLLSTVLNVLLLILFCVGSITSCDLQILIPVSNWYIEIFFSTNLTGKL